MDYQPSYGFLKDCLYRSESYKVTLADAYAAPTAAAGADAPANQLSRLMSKLRRESASCRCVNHAHTGCRRPRRTATNAWRR